MDHMKYFIFIGEFGLSRPIIFDSGLSHEQVAKTLLDPHNWDDEDEFKNKIISAGFVVMDPLGNDGLLCYGRSTTMDISSRGDIDAELINRMLGKGEH